MIAGRRHYRFATHRGQAMIEYLIIFPALLLLVLGAIQFALIYQAKFTLNYATFMAARQGALKNAKLTSIKDSLAGGMTPLFMRAGTTPDLADLAKARLIATIEVFNPLTSTVEIISPTQAAYDVMNDGTAMPNDNLMYRSGSGDGMSIQDANLLKVRVTYCVRLMVPFVNRVIYSISNGIAGVKNLTNEYFWINTPTVDTSRPCTTISEMYAGVRQEISSISSGLPAGVSIVDSAASSIISTLPSSFPTTIPGLNWDVGGMRIPITAEAIVRMQSPAARDSLPP
ncbi:MAG: pilus assembly protein [Betaproteobacteria bacterium]|nr:pilus assembly protein [Betaproteobacteria bacterium]